MSFQLSNRSILRLDGVHPVLVSVVRAAIAISKVDFTVLEGRRTLEKQREYFNAGKSRTMASRHLTGHAVDLAPILDTDGDGDTELSWNPDDFLPLNDAMQQAAANLGVKVTWGGSWKGFYDGPHFEIRPEDYPWL